MTLAGMISTDEEAFICDMAETYQIYDYRRVPCKLLGTLAAGLRDDSRIKMKMSGVKAGTEALLLADILDVTQYLLWAQTEDGQKGKHRPKSVAQRFYERKEVDHSHDLSHEEYMRIRNSILNKGAKK